MTTVKSLKKKPLLILGLCLCLFLSVTVNAYNVRSSDIAVYVPATGALGFQNEPDIYVLLSVLTGSINSTTNILRLSRGVGVFQWLALNDSTVRVTYTVDGSVAAMGDSGNAWRRIDSGTTLTVTTGETVRVEWKYNVHIWLPIMFIFGMIGLVGTFGSSLYCVNMMKKGKFFEGLRTTVIFGSLSIALVLAWLWGGA